MAAHPEHQVATVFDLIAGVLIAEAAALLLVEVEREAQAAVDPTLADLAQSPYRPRLGQGVCDLCQACGVGDGRKQFPSLVKRRPPLHARQATYSWPFKITWAGNGGCPLILIVRWTQSGSRMWNE